jgi:hypothetical protein
MPKRTPINAPSLHQLSDHPNSDVINGERKKAAEILRGSEVSRWPSGDKVSATLLWENQAMFVFVVRRPGCQFCRAHAILIGHTKLLLSKLGFGFAAIIASKRQDEIEGFGQKAWTGKIYTDEHYAFITALGGGEVIIIIQYRKVVFGIHKAIRCTSTGANYSLRRLHDTILCLQINTVPIKVPNHISSSL